MDEVEKTLSEILDTAQLDSDRFTLTKEKLCPNLNRKLKPI